MIARCWILRPLLIVADEPTSMIDASSRGGIIKLLEELREEQGTSIIFITHDLGLAYYVSDKILVMKDGEVVESGHPDKVVCNHLMSTQNYLSKVFQNYTENLKGCDVQICFTRAVLTIFAWAFVLELLVLTYYLGKGPKPFEFYLNLALMVFTTTVLIFVITKEKKQKELEEQEIEEKRKRVGRRKYAGSGENSKFKSLGYSLD